MAERELTYTEVAEHASKNDIYVVVHDSVYDCSKFIDEHPGGEEVMLDVAGQDATESFEDVGHSDEARQILAGMRVGKLKRSPNDPSPKTASPFLNTSTTTSDATTFGLGLYALILLGAAAAYTAYAYLQSQKQNN